MTKKRRKKEIIENEEREVMKEMNRVEQFDEVEDMNVPEVHDFSGVPDLPFAPEDDDIDFAPANNMERDNSGEMSFNVDMLELDFENLVRKSVDD